MEKRCNPKLKGVAQHLRKHMTKEEKKIWYEFLKKLPVTVQRQKVIGNYIVDFYVAKKQLVIEIDGFQHGKEENREKDAERDAALKDSGISVLRITNYEINNYFESVCNRILKALELNQASNADE